MHDWLGFYAILGVLGHRLIGFLSYVNLQPHLLFMEFIVPRARKFDDVDTTIPVVTTIEEPTLTRNNTETFRQYRSRLKNYLIKRTDFKSDRTGLICDFTIDGTKTHYMFAETINHRRYCLFHIPDNGSKIQREVKTYSKQKILDKTSNGLTLRKFSWET